MTENEIQKLSDTFRRRFGADASQHALMRLVSNRMLDDKTFTDCLRFGWVCARNYSLTKLMREARYRAIDRFISDDSDVPVDMFRDPVDYEAQSIARMTLERARPDFEPVLERGFRHNSSLHRLRKSYRERGLM